MQILSVYRALEPLLKSRWWNKFNPYFFFLCYIPIDVVVQFFLCFSLIKNTSRIMDTKVPASAITSINGMRVMSMWWVILGHVYGFQTVSAMSKYCSLHKAIFDRLLTIVWVWFCSTSPWFFKKIVWFLNQTDSKWKPILSRKNKKDG